MVGEMEITIQGSVALAEEVGERPLQNSQFKAQKRNRSGML